MQIAVGVAVGQGTGALFGNNLVGRAVGGVVGVTATLFVGLASGFANLFSGLSSLFGGAAAVAGPAAASIPVSR